MNSSRILIIFIVCITGSISLHAQTDPACPTITVSGPAGVTQPGEVIDFTAEVSGQVAPKTVYEWSVSVGEIIAGQGTLNIKVRTGKEWSNYTATLRLLGLPAGCPNSASESAPIDCVCDPILWDEFDKVTPREERARLDAAVNELKQRPNFKLVLIEYFDSRTSDRLIAARIKRRVDYLTRTRGVAQKYVEVLSGGILETRTKIFLVGPAAENPSP